MHIEVLGVQDNQIGDVVQLELDGDGSLAGSSLQIWLIVQLVLDGPELRGKAPFDLRGYKDNSISIRLAICSGAP